MWRLVKWSYWIIALFITIGIVINAIKFFEPDFSAGFLHNKARHFWWYAPPLYLHIVSASLVSLLGLMIFVLPKNSKWHIYMGRLYFVVVTLAAAPSGISMAALSIGGWPSIINFTILGLLWLWFTTNTYRYAKNKQLKWHKRFAYRSLIISNSAVLMRLLYFVATYYLEVERVLAYQVTVWLSWLPLLILFEAVNRVRKTTYI